MTRRSFLRSTTAVGLSTFGSAISGLVSSSLLSCESVTPEQADLSALQLLPRPLIINGGPITASYNTSSYWPNAATSTQIMLNGSTPCPTIKLGKGDILDVAFHNFLGEPSIIHWHGLSAPPEMDGHPSFQILSGASYAYSFPVTDRAATYWYHAHPDKLTGKQAYTGFAGVLIVEDPAEPKYDLPSGIYDVSVVLQDKRVSVNGEVVYSPSHDDTISGFLGNYIFANGVPNAVLNVERATYRLRLINASNSRVFKLAFDDGRPLAIIANDGGLLEKPVSVDSVWIASGERIELFVDFSGDPSGSKIKLKSEAYPFPSSHRGELYPQGLELTCIEFAVQPAVGVVSMLPTAFRSIPRLDVASAKRMQIFKLSMNHSTEQGIHLINDKLFEMDRSDITIPLGELEVWEIQNEGDGFHSMHIHGTQFQVIERMYGPESRLPTDEGWKDTVLVFPNETVRLAVKFDLFKGRYLFHCHTLEHEDDGMMLNIDVT